MYEVLHKQELAPGLIRMDVKAPRVARKAKAGQFIVLRVGEDGERIPLTIADHHGDAVTIIFQEVGLSTRLLGQVPVGGYLHDFVGPLGRPSDFHGAQRVVCIGGGVGTAVVYPQVKYLHAQGVYVDVINGARTKNLVILEEELRGNCDHLYITTDDGSYVRQGFVTDVLRELLAGGERYDQMCIRDRISTSRERRKGTPICWSTGPPRQPPGQMFISRKKPVSLLLRISSRVWMQRSAPSTLTHS